MEINNSGYTMFGRYKNKGLKNLNDDEKVIAKGFRKKKTREALVQECFKIKNTNLIKYYLDNYSIYPDQHHHLILSALRHKHVDGLKLVVEKMSIYPWHGYDYGDADFSEMATANIYGRCLTNKENQDIDALTFLAKTYTDYDTGVQKTFLNEVINENWLGGIQSCLDTWVYKNIFYPHALQFAVNHANAKTVEYILKIGAEHFSQEDLNTALDIVLQSSEKNIHKVKSLLKHGASPNMSRGGLKALVRSENKDVFDVLIDGKLDVTTHVPPLIDLLKKESPSSLMIPYLASVLDYTRQLENEQDNYDLITPEQLCEKTSISSNMTLTTIFNFQLREEVKITENIKTGQMTMAVRNLDELPSATLAFIEKKFKEKNGNIALLNIKPDFEKKPILKTKKTNPDGGRNVSP